MRRRERRRGRSGQHGGDSFEGINITPFTDVLLVLLIIFMIAGSSMAPTGLGLSALAAGGEATPGSEDKSVVVLEIDADGATRFKLDGNPLNWDQLETMPRSTRVTLLVEADTPAELVVRQYDRLLTLGLKEVQWGPPRSSDEI